MRKYVALKFFVVLFISFFCLLGCDDNLHVVEGKIGFIQDQYNKGGFKETYSTTSDEFKKAMSEADFIKLMIDKNRVLGHYQSSKVLFTQDINNSVVRITYLSVYDKFTLAEEFTFKKNISSHEYELAGYLLDNGGKIVPVTQTGSSFRIDI